ncbi:MAG: ABC transporter permease [Candidatus Cyclobacteriaceae bacterium M2_1C_046]
MLKNYFKIAFRNLNRFKGYAGINLLGLALGLTCGILIMLFVFDELSYDKFHTNYDRIYKIYSGGNETSGWPIGVKVAEYPEVEKVVYTRSSGFQVMHENKRFDEKIHYAGEQFFDIFSFNFIEGNPSKALEGPFKAVLTKEIAEKYYGSTDIVGQTITLADSIEFEITGVIENVPRQSHMQFTMLISFDTYPHFNKSFTYSDGWGNLNVRNYVLLKEHVDAEAFEAKVTNLYMDNVGEFLKQMGMEIYVHLQPLSDVYLKEGLSNGFGPKGSINQVFLVSAIAIFVILLACINFINLTTAKSAYRAKEVGLRKIVGSSRSALFWQFIAESFVITLLSFFIVALIIDLILPFFNELIGRNFQFNDLFQPQIIIGSILLIVLITLLSGYYPAMVLSGYKPAETLKGKLTTSLRGSGLRKGLVLFQFVVSSLLVVGTLLVLDQLRFMQEKDPGFEKEQVLVVHANHIYGDSLELASFKNQIKNLAAIDEVSYTNAFPGKPGWQGQWANPEGFPKDEPYETEYMSVDDDYISTLGLELIAGRNFDIRKASDLQDGLIVNETAVNLARWNSPEEAIGKKITSPSGTPEGIIIGVVKDYHQEGLQKNIWPIVMDYDHRWSSYFAIKFVTGNTAELVDQLNKVWKTNYPDREFSFMFLNEKFDAQYRAEVRLINVLLLFTIITIIIAVIGLFGLVSFMVVSRTKEIGVRKVLGAGVFDVTRLLSWEFLKLVLIANIIITPIAWYLGGRWLDNFAYRMELDPLIFILTLVASIGVALLTVGYQTLKAALQNPVDSLRSE